MNTEQGTSNFRSILNKIKVVYATKVGCSLFGVQLFLVECSIVPCWAKGQKIKCHRQPATNKRGRTVLPVRPLRTYEGRLVNSRDGSGEVNW